ncbi:hypothetical protein LCGC14_1019990 [marine sediment metagenome]|uniref:Uncharacterized protein n=1 Tax=marine sediment metagenome TaxID=412755 RepID=A0A0F9MXP2_9ZZZZ
MDIPFLKDFAVQTNFDMTNPLSHNEVKELALRWLPQFRFHEDELFHPISINQVLYTGRTSINTQWWLEDKDGFLISPWVLFKSHDDKESLNFNPSYPPNSKFNSTEITRKSHFTNLKDTEYDIAKALFGSKEMYSGMQLPRFPGVTMGEFRSLLETLYHNLRAYVDYPAELYDDDEGRVLDEIIGPPLFGDKKSEWRKLLELVEMERLGQREGSTSQTYNNLLNSLIEDGIISEIEWEIIRFYGILEYHLCYEYNDWSAHQIDIFANEHEGDVEGCALVFNLNTIKAVYKKTQEESQREIALSTLKPDFIMTAAHNESNNLDEIKDLRGLPEDEILSELKVWVSLGSHASYLSGAGTHDTVPGLETGAAIGAGVTCLVFPPACLVALLLALLAKGAPEDETSNKGVYMSSDPGSSSSPKMVPIQVETTPLSKHLNMFQERFEGDFGMETSVNLAERVYPGLWGGHDGLINYSSPFTNKTKRFIHKLRWFFEHTSSPGAVY